MKIYEFLGFATSTLIHVQIYLHSGYSYPLYLQMELIFLFRL